MIRNRDKLLLFLIFFAIGLFIFISIQYNPLTSGIVAYKYPNEYRVILLYDTNSGQKLIKEAILYPESYNEYQINDIFTDSIKNKNNEIILLNSDKP